MSESNVTDSEQASRIVQLSANIVAAYVSKNTIAPDALPGLIENATEALAQSAEKSLEPAYPEPAVPVDKSLNPDHIICLECGKRFRTLKRHLLTDHDLTPMDYREKWRLSERYPMTAPDYAKRRAQIAKRMGLGKTHS